MSDTASPRPLHYGKDVFFYPILICLFFFLVGEYYSGN